MAEADRHRGDLFPVRRGGDQGTGGFRQLDADALEHAHVAQPVALALGAHGLGDVGGAEVGRVGEHFRQHQRALLAFEVGDREAADMDRVAGVIDVPQVRDAAVQGHRGGLQLERAAGFVDAGDGAVEPLRVGGRANEVGIIVGQADHGQHFAGTHVHHDAAAADGVEILQRLGQFVAHDGLDLDVERQLQLRVVLAQPLIELLFHPGDAVAVHVHAAEHMGRGAAERVAAALGLFEIHAGYAEIVDRHLFARVELAGEVDELLFRVGQPFGGLGLVQFRQDLLELVRGFRRVDHFLGVGVERDGGQRHREELAVAIGDHGALRADRGVGGLLRFQQLGDRTLRTMRHQRLDDGGIRELQCHGQEQQREAGGGEDQPPAGFFQFGAAMQVRRGDPHVLHHGHGAAARRTGPAHRQPARRGVGRWRAGGRTVGGRLAGQLGLANWLW